MRSDEPLILHKEIFKLYTAASSNYWSLEVDMLHAIFFHAKTKKRKNYQEIARLT